MAEALDLTTPVDSEKEKEEFESTVALPGSIRVKADGLEKETIISVAFEPRMIGIVEHNHDFPIVGSDVLDFSAIDIEHDLVAFLRVAEEMTEEVIQRKVVSEHRNIERDDLAAVNKLPRQSST